MDFTGDISQREVFEWEVSLRSRSEGPWSVWQGWRRGSGEDALGFEGRGASSSCTWTSNDGGQRHQSRDVPERGCKSWKEKCDSKGFHRWQAAVGARDQMEE